MTRFLRLFSKIFGGFFRRKSADSIVAKSENVTRYVFDKDYFRRSPPKPTARFQVFLPRNGETSVFRIARLNDAEIWSLGNEQVARLRGRTIKARADITIQKVESVGVEKGYTKLTVVPETSTHPLHANIVGWPEEESAIQMIAVELANHAELNFPPSLYSSVARME